MTNGEKKNGRQAKRKSSTNDPFSTPEFQDDMVIASNGIPALLDMVRDEEVGLKDAAVVASMPEEEQEELVALGPQAVKKWASRDRQAKRNGSTNGNGEEKEFGDAWIKVFYDLTVALNSLRYHGLPSQDASRWPAEKRQRWIVALDSLIEGYKQIRLHLKGESGRTPKEATG